MEVSGNMSGKGESLIGIVTAPRDLPERLALILLDILDLCVNGHLRETCSTQLVQ